MDGTFAVAVIFATATDVSVGRWQRPQRQLRMTPMARQVRASFDDGLGRVGGALRGSRDARELPKGKSSPLGPT